MSNEIRRLYRSRNDRMIGGFCSGLGQFLGIDSTVVRLIAVLTTFMWPPTPLVYLALMLVVPEAPPSQEAIQSGELQPGVETPRE